MKYYEVNTVLNTDGEIATSNTFTDFDEAKKFYESISEDEKKEFVEVDEDGFYLDCIDINYND